jgi:hypothetical protein
MKGRTGAAAALTATVLAGLLWSGCGGREGAAAEEQQPKKNPITGTEAPASTATATAVAPAPPPVVTDRPADRTDELKAISKAIPIYAGAKYRDDLTRRDEVMIRNQYGQQADVITFATDDSYPQVYHYYTTYLAQFRAYPAQPPYPSAQNWRTLEVHLNDAMQDPFIPGDMLKPGDRQITLQIAETEAEPKIVIRYILTPQPIQTAEK